jgi:hypothetical protein
MKKRSVIWRSNFILLFKTMKPETKILLSSARKFLGIAAKILVKREQANGALTLAERTSQLSIGTAKDYIGWAEFMTHVEYQGNIERSSNRREGIAETLRFTQMWTAANALFAHDDVLRSAGGTVPFPKPEGDRFGALYNLAAIDGANEAASMQTLYQLLGMECKSVGLAPRLGLGNPTMWEVIDAKYSRPEDRARGIGKIIANAIASGNMPTPNGPTLIYGVRNWTVHGMLLTSFFRGSPQKYLTFINNITFLLAASLAGASQKITVNV